MPPPPPSIKKVFFTLIFNLKLKLQLCLECEMSSIHGLLSQIPQDLPFEKLLVEAQILYEYHPPHSVKVTFMIFIFYCASKETEYGAAYLDLFRDLTRKEKKILPTFSAL